MWRSKRRFLFVCLFWSHTYSIYSTKAKKKKMIGQSHIVPLVVIVVVVVVVVAAVVAVVVVVVVLLSEVISIDYAAIVLR